MKRILLSGYYGFGNVGDEAILTSTIKTLQLQAPGVQIAVLSNEPAETARTYNVRAMHRMWPHHVLNAISETDLVVFGGGSLLQDDTSLRSLLYYLSVIFLAKIMGKPVIVYANGIGPLHSRLGRFLTRVALNTVKDITVRDQESFKELKKIGVNKNITVTADPAFLLAPAGKENVDCILKQAGVPEHDKYVWLSLRDVGAPGSFDSSVCLLAEKLRENGFYPCFLVMQERDKQYIQKLNANLDQPLPIVDNLTPEETLGVLQRGVLCLGMRLHTLILAARVGVPFLGIDIDPKIHAFCKAAGNPLIPLPVENQYTLWDSFEKLINGCTDYARSLNSKLPEFQRLASTNISRILDILSLST